MRRFLPTSQINLFSSYPRISRGDVIVMVTLVAAIAFGILLSSEAPSVVHGPSVSLSLRALPLYAACSLARMFAAYILSLLFTIFYGYAAAFHRKTRWLLLPLLDIFQSVPLLSFLPLALLSLSAFLPQRLAAEMASVFLIFTCQAWNLTYSWYQSLTTIPNELQEAGRIFQFNRWLRFRTLEFPFATIGLIWNSMVSWANGWFFLMAAEIFTVGNRDFRLPGLGAYLREAATQGNIRALAWGVGLLTFIIVAMDQLVWRPLLAWSDRRKIEMTEGALAPSSWFYNALVDSKIIMWLDAKFLRPIADKIDLFSVIRHAEKEAAPRKSGALRLILLGAFTVALGWMIISGLYSAFGLLRSLTLHQWFEVVSGAGATLARVYIALGIALAWTVPLGIAIGTSRRLARWLQPPVQILASLPATALFPASLLFFLKLPFGLNLAVVFLMLMGTQWYLLFNVIGGANAIPQDLKYTAQILQLSPWERLRTLLLPAVYPFVLTGAITASGGAWNASMVSEYVDFGGKTYQTRGLGSLIANATAQGNYALLFAATLSMIFMVTVINRLVWRRLYRLAQDKYRMD